MTLTDHELYLPLVAIIHRLSLKSHVSAAPVGRSSKDSSGSIGGKRPGEPTAVRLSEDYQIDYALKTADYFARELGRARTVRRLEELHSEAVAAEEAWRRTSIPEGQPPAMDDPQWKRWVATSGKSVDDIVRIYGVSRRYVYKLRSDYA